MRFRPDVKLPGLLAVAALACAQSRSERARVVRTLFWDPSLTLPSEGGDSGRGEASDWIVRAWVELEREHGEAFSVRVQVKADGTCIASARVDLSVSLVTPGPPSDRQVRSEPATVR